jgi:hypothetical protein
MVVDAGHSKFTQEQINFMEQDILLTLGFKICSLNLFSEACILFKRCLSLSSFEDKLPQEDKEKAFNLVRYFCYMCALASIRFSQINQRDLTVAIVSLALTYLKCYYQLDVGKACYLHVMTKILNGLLHSCLMIIDECTLKKL